jgi:uncharacterized protein
MAGTSKQGDMKKALAPIGLGLMCKPPRPGTSKTRLAAGIGADAAAKLSAAFLSDCAQVASSAAARSSLERTAFYKPSDAAKELGQILGPGWPLEFADAPSLGSIMSDILGRILTVCPAGALIMGTDIPLIGPDLIENAAHHLREGNDRTIVIAPTVDGGYCLIGARKSEAAAPLFEDMAWSTSQVLDETLRRARAEGLDVKLLDVQHDVDELPDLHWLREAIVGHPGRATATRHVLSTLTLPPRK